VGSAVSASGRLYAVRRPLVRPLPDAAIADDFAISTQVIGAGFRLAFDPSARVKVALPAVGRAELRRKVRVMNGGLRAALALLTFRLVRDRPAYVVQLVSHKILRRFVPFFLVAMLVASAIGARSDAAWWLVLGPQLLFYALAIAGSVVQARGRRGLRGLSVAYYFCLSNVAAALAVLSLVGRVRYETWESAPTRAVAAVRGG
jgi:cellulose synthase/poly-beta-1,6-N-acetylglucosamine synthase-like glycosyltransferase